MDTKDSNIKPQETGGLKLMTVFIAVLALHVVVIGGFTVYHLMSGGSTDADLGALDKTHKGLKGADVPAVAEGALPDASQGDKSATAPAPLTEVANIPANSPALATVPAPSTEAAASPANPPAAATVPAPSTEAAASPANPAPIPVPAPAPMLSLTAPKPATLTPPAQVADQGARTPTGPILSELAPPPEPAPVLLAPIASGPVHMPAVATPAPASQQIYVVKITDSYKKIAHEHHITVAQLKEANHIKTDVLHTGQKLVIPPARTAVADNAPASSTALDSSPTGPVLNQPAPAPTAILASAPSTMAATVPRHRLYTVVKGDTLIRIAHKFRTTPKALMTENSITDPTKLAIGKKLRIPSEESRSARNGAPASTQPGQVQAKGNAPTAQLANFVR